MFFSGNKFVVQTQKFILKLVTYYYGHLFAVKLNPDNGVRYGRAESSRMEGSWSIFGMGN